MTDFHVCLEAQIPRLRRYGRALMRNASLADDLVQETLARAIEKQHLWKRGTDMRAWLFAIMHNQYVNHVRRAVRDAANIDLDACSQTLAGTSDPTALRQLRELEHALGQLREEQRQVVLLIGLEGMSYEETAAILNVPVGTVRSRLSRGRQALRHLMNLEDEGRSSAFEHYLAATPLAA